MSKVTETVSGEEVGEWVFNVLMAVTRKIDKDIGVSVEVD